VASNIVLTDMILCMSPNEEQLSESGVLLRNAGYESFQCLDAADALRFLSYRKVELIITDESLDTEAGQSVLKKARSFYPRIPIICWLETKTPPQNIVDLDPDVTLSRSDGDAALLKIISILTGDST
jgi:DNA-binding NtrC family response regulator